MNEEMTQPPTEAEARAALAEVGQVLAQTRQTIACGPTAPILIMWGVIWLVANLTTQFHSESMQWLWWVLDAIGIGGTWWIVARHRVQVRRPGMWKVGVFWFALFGYAALWLYLLLPVGWPKDPHGWQDFEPTYRRICTYMHTVCMFGYVMFGLWLGRFFLWLGLLVTALILLGYYGNFPYYYAWLGIAGGGSLIISGVFIRKFWK